MNVFQAFKEAVRPYYLRWLFFRLSERNCPPALRSWTGYPSIALDRIDTGQLPLSDGLADFVFLPMADWHGITQRSQHMAEGLAKRGHRCVYLNPHLGREFPYPFPWSERALVTKLRDRVVELHVHLPREPVFHHRRLSHREAATVTERTEALLGKMQSSEQILVMSFPIWAEVALELKRKLNCQVVYDCHDLLEDFGDVSPSLLAAEAKAMHAADLVLFSSEWLADEHRMRDPSLTGKSMIIRNAANPGDFPFSPAAKRQKVPTIGYTGSLNSWFDVKMLRFAATRHPEWEFLLVGGASPSFPLHAFDDLPNVELRGEVPYTEIPLWLSRFDVAVIPFLIQPLTQATNPVKLYEYFAHGLPVVASRIPELEAFGNLVYPASTPQEFLEQLEAALNEREPKLRLERRRIAEAETWDARCEYLVNACRMQFASSLVLNLDAAATANRG